MGFVYLIESIDAGTCKIGITKNDPNKRLKQLSTGNDSPLILVSTFKTDNYRKLESWLHRKYSDKRLNGEWFMLSEEDINSFTATCHSINETITILLKENDFFN